MAEKEYIERGALIAEYDRAHKGPPGGARKLMEDAPAADVVEVVRCKDCKNYSEFDATNRKRLTFHFCKLIGNIARENDFCSHGERKTI